MAEYHSDGVLRKSFTVDGKGVALVGSYDNDGKPWSPDVLNVCAELPGHLFKAVLRANVWVSTYANGQPDCLHMPLNGSRGKPLGSVYFWPIVPRFQNGAMIFWQCQGRWNVSYRGEKPPKGFPYGSCEAIAGLKGVRPHQLFTYRETD